MKRPWLILIAGLVTVLLFGVHRSGLAQDEGRPLRYWPIAKSDTWDGTPHPRARYMATVGLSEWSTGLQLSGFRGAADLNLVEEAPPQGVRRFVRVTALKARITGVFQKDNVVVIRIRPELKGYEVSGVDVSDFPPGTRLTFTFKDPLEVEVARDTVLIE